MRTLVRFGAGSDLLEDSVKLICPTLLLLNHTVHLPLFLSVWFVAGRLETFSPPASSPRNLSIRPYHRSHSLFFLLRVISSPVMFRAWCLGQQHTYASRSACWRGKSSWPWLAYALHSMETNGQAISVCCKVSPSQQCPTNQTVCPFSQRPSAQVVLVEVTDI